MKRSWLQVCVYAVSLVIGLVLDIYRPDVKSVLCTPLNVGGQTPSVESSNRIERVK